MGKNLVKDFDGNFLKVLSKMRKQSFRPISISEDFHHTKFGGESHYIGNALAYVPNSSNVDPGIYFLEKSPLLDNVQKTISKHKKGKDIIFDSIDDYLLNSTYFSPDIIQDSKSGSFIVPPKNIIQSLLCSNQSYDLLLRVLPLGYFIDNSSILVRPLYFTLNGNNQELVGMNFQLHKDFRPFRGISK